MRKNICLLIGAMILFSLPHVVFGQTIPQGNWSLLFTNSEELVKENGKATNVFDGKATTIWHTEYGTTTPVHPHELQIDLGDIYDVTAFHYLPRQEGGINGTIKSYKIYLSQDKANWGNPISSGLWANNTEKKTVTFSAPITGRYLRLVALSEVNGRAWASAAEISLTGELYNKPVQELPYGKLRVTIEKSTDTRVTGHNLYYSADPYVHSEKKDMGTSATYDIPAGTLTPDKVYRITATSYGTVDNKPSESIHSNAIYILQKPQVTDPPVEPPIQEITLTAPIIIRIILPPTEE